MARFFLLLCDYAETSFITLLLLFLTWALLLWWRFGGKSSLEGTGRTLLITAHPDDECMFFAPTILALTKAAPENVYLLCLSEGNYYGKGVVRKHELYRSATTLGIRRDHVAVVNEGALPDIPGVEWQPEVIIQHISTSLEQHAIQTIITFDLGGVSGHSNHISLYKAVRVMQLEPKHRPVTVLLLESTGLLRKYVGFLDLPLSLASSFYSIGTLSDYNQARKAMIAHRSQYVWFRKLYVCFSRYMVINTFKELKPSDYTRLGQT